MGQHHMRRQDRQVTGQTELLDIMRRGKVAVVAMCRGDEPYAVSLDYGYDPDAHAMYFHCADDGLKLDFVRANPRVCAVVVIDHGYRMGHCEHPFESLIVRGSVTEITDPEEKVHAMVVMLRHLEDDPDGMAKRLLGNASGLSKTVILTLAIDDMTGKKGK